MLWHSKGLGWPFGSSVEIMAYNVVAHQTLRIKNISSKVFPGSMSQVNKQTPTCLYWAKKRRIKRNLNVDSEGLMIKSTELGKPESTQRTCENKIRTSAGSDAEVNLPSPTNCLSNDIERVLTRHIIIQGSRWFPFLKGN